MHKFLKIISISVMCLSANISISAPTNVPVSERTSLFLSIYNSDLAMINDQRSVKLTQGFAQFDFEAVSSLINHASAIFYPIPDNAQIVHQQFRMPISPAELLKRSIGQSVTLMGANPASGEAVKQRAVIVAVEGGLILEINGQIETDLAGRRIVYDQLPEGVLSPTLSVGIQSEQTSETELTLSYLSGGLSWQADYIAVLNEAEDKMSLRAMATLENHSGVDFLDAQTELIAGSVNQVQEQMHRPFEGRAMSLSMAKSEPASRVALSDLHLYSLHGRFDLFDNSAIQVVLFSASDIPAQKEYRLSGQANLYYSPNVAEQKQTVDRYISFNNTDDANLGLPLPAGVVRVYKRQSTAQHGAMRFVGENRITHTPEEVKVRIKTGQAFDLDAMRLQHAYRRLPVEQPYRNHNEVEVETIITNAKEVAVQVNVEEVFAGEWSLINGPKPAKTRARSAVWAVQVPANGKANLRLTVRVKS